MNEVQARYRRTIHFQSRSLSLILCGTGGKEDVCGRRLTNKSS